MTNSPKSGGDSQKPTRYWVPEDHLFSDAEHSVKAFPEQAASWMIGANHYDQLMQQAQKMREALQNAYMQFADLSSRVKAPDQYMLQEAKQALEQFDEFMKDKK